MTVEGRPTRRTMPNSSGSACRCRNGISLGNALRRESTVTANTMNWYYMDDPAHPPDRHNARVRRASSLNCAPTGSSLLDGPSRKSSEVWDAPSPVHRPEPAKPTENHRSSSRNGPVRWCTSTSRGREVPDGGVWRAHAHGPDQTKRSRRRKTRNRQSLIDYTYLHFAIDGTPVWRTRRLDTTKPQQQLWIS